MTGITISPGILYIEPVTSCNLRCKGCNTKQTQTRELTYLTADEILNFIDRYMAWIRRGHVEVFLCGTGEVFMHPELAELVRAITADNSLDLVIQTNGQLDYLARFGDLSRISFIVSIDGPKAHHEANRGKGTYDKAMWFAEHASYGAKDVSIRMLPSSKSLKHLDSWHDELDKRLRRKVNLRVTFPDPVEGVEFAKESEILEHTDRYGYHRYPAKFIPDGIELYPSVFIEGIYSCCLQCKQIGQLYTPIETLMSSLCMAASYCFYCDKYPCEVESAKEDVT